MLSFASRVCVTFTAARGHSLDSQLLAVTEGEAIIGESAEHDGGVHHVLLEAQEPHVQTLEPHEHSIVCATQARRKVL